MKKMNKNLFFFLLFIIFVSYVFTHKLKNKQSNEVFEKQLFPQGNRPDCKSHHIENQVGGFSYNLKTQVGTSRDFSWINDWGIGQCSYFYDFLDPIIGDEFIMTSIDIFAAVSRFSSETYKEYTDPLLIEVVDERTGKVSKKAPISKDMDTTIYNHSINAVQIKQAIESFHWSFNEASKDPALDFVQKYDINADSRLNERELILGVIIENQNKYLEDRITCVMCLENIVQSITTIFHYIDCESDGNIIAENLIKNIPNIKREDHRWNIIPGLELGVRQKSINHFFIQNSKTVNGELTLNEFQKGILLGFWNRQTNNEGIIKNSSKNLKHLRWINNDLIDKEVSKYEASVALKNKNKN